MFVHSYALVPYILGPGSVEFRLSSVLCLLSSANCPLIPNVIIRRYLRTCKELYNCRDIFTNVMSALQIHLFLQNKAKLRKVKLNVNKVLTTDYEQLDTWSIRTKQSQTNPNKAKTNPILVEKTPLRTQFKANTKPKRTQFKPNLSWRSLWRSRNKPNFYTIGTLYCLQLPLTSLNLIRNCVYGYQ